jgi:hypothetical protein
MNAPPFSFVPIPAVATFVFRFREFTLSLWHLSEAALNEPELMRKRFLCVKTPPCEFVHTTCIIVPHANNLV